MAEEIDVVTGDSRRDFLKKSIIVGAAVWTAPAVISLPGSRALAASPVCECSASGYALSVKLLTLAPIVLGQSSVCVLGPLPIGLPNVASVNASIICSSVVGCQDTSDVASVDVTVGLDAAPTLRINATVLESQATADCNACNTTGRSLIASLTVNNTNVTAASLTCNNDILATLGLGALGSLIFDEEVCTGDSLSVNALHLTVPGIIDLVVAHSEASATGCPCIACGTN